MAIGDVTQGADERLDDRVLGRHEHARLDELEKDLDAVALDGGLLVALVVAREVGEDAGGEYALREVGRGGREQQDEVLDEELEAVEARRRIGQVAQRDQTVLDDVRGGGA